MSTMWARKLSVDLFFACLMWCVCVHFKPVLIGVTISNGAKIMYSWLQIRAGHDMRVIPKHVLALPRETRKKVCISVIAILFHSPMSLQDIVAGKGTNSFLARISRTFWSSTRKQSLTAPPSTLYSVKGIKREMKARGRQPLLARLVSGHFPRNLRRNPRKE